MSTKLGHILGHIFHLKVLKIQKSSQSCSYYQSSRLLFKLFNQGNKFELFNIRVPWSLQLINLKSISDYTFD